jgi:hypothetical protein
MPGHPLGLSWHLQGKHYQRDLLANCRRLSGSAMISVAFEVSGSRCFGSRVVSPRNGSRLQFESERNIRDPPTQPFVYTSNNLGGCNVGTLILLL